MRTANIVRLQRMTHLDVTSVVEMLNMLYS
jgi:hypothetical protein